MKQRLGKNIKKFRTDKHISQETLCKIIGITKRHLIRVEKGEVDPSFSLIQKISKALSVSIDNLGK
ncbi:helix-turn-helix transcriptional regulator [Candidatus Margulisiibacteriota bacterium]